MEFQSNSNFGHSVSLQQQGEIIHGANTRGSSGGAYQEHRLTGSAGGNVSGCKLPADISRNLTDKHESISEETI